MRGKSETNFWWSVVVRGGPSQTLTDQVILFQPGGQVLPTTLLLSSPPPDFLTFLRHWHVKTMGLLFTQHMLQENYFSLVTNFRVKEVKSKVLLTYFFKRTKSTLLKFYSKIAVNTNFEVSSHSQLTCNVSLICSIDDLTRVATHHLFDLDLFTFIFLMNCY